MVKPPLQFSYSDASVAQFAIRDRFGSKVFVGASRYLPFHSGPHSAATRRLGLHTDTDDIAAVEGVQPGARWA